jgi:hypothetical protein
VVLVVVAWRSIRQAPVAEDLPKLRDLRLDAVDSPLNGVEAL